MKLTISISSSSYANFYFIEREKSGIIKSHKLILQFSGDGGGGGLGGTGATPSKIFWQTHASQQFF